MDQLAAGLVGAGNRLHQTVQQMFEALHQDQRTLGSQHYPHPTPRRPPAEQQVGEVEGKDSAHHTEGMFSDDVEIAIDNVRDYSVSLMACD